MKGCEISHRLLGAREGLRVDADAAEALGHLPWRLIAGRVIAVVANRFFDLLRMIGGPGLIRRRKA